jgi:alpha-tubulin suppressor-like RCC1 family protein
MKGEVYVMGSNTQG